MTDKITIEREALERVLKVLDFALPMRGDGDALRDASNALRAALDAQPAKPVASYGEIESACRHAFEIEDGYGDPDSNPQRYRIFRDGFFAAMVSAQPAPAAVPLTDEQIVAMFRETFVALADPMGKDNMTTAFARAVERAHGIGDKP